MDGASDVRVVGIELRDFRTYERAEAALGPGLTVVHGPNGAGKSNLLEALYFGCTGRSPRTRNERELVRFDAPAARVVVRCREGSQQHELSVAYGPGASGERPAKRLTADGAPVERLLDVDFRPLLSFFEPDRLELLKGAPSVRRAHLDQLVAALWPLRASDRREYSRVLAQRNALLARIRSGRASDATLAAWDRELATLAIAVREHRAAALQLLAEPFHDRAAQLGLVGDAALVYRPRSRAVDVDEFVAELNARVQSDLERGFSGHGPHRDELALLRDGRELRLYGSQGEQRLALLALLLAERDVLAHERRRMPLMLLDDVMSELDAERRELLAGELASGGQSVIATTDFAHVPGAGSSHVARLRITTGAILQEALAA
ncbi:MAG TPA: DNA replication and repair protein RecF [Solirubrobacteraceae bacterium]|jgi:DNA replication and repair protein RecF|nr:DNA replication and repair protein RecF [Solirubrobacteraceae bacterium]